MEIAMNDLDKKSFADTGQAQDIVESQLDPSSESQLDHLAELAIKVIRAYRTENDLEEDS
jgi:hypothetical protein